MFGQLFFSSRQLSQTADEATHLHSGYRYLKCGDLTTSPEHPPLAKMVAAAPLMAMNTPVDCTPFQGNGISQQQTDFNWFYSSPDWRTELFRGRLAISIFAISLCIFVWIMARQMFGLGTAIIATALVSFEPNLLAHGALITTDMAVTAVLLFAVFSFYLWIRRPSLPLLLLAGIAAGLTLLSKASGVVLIPMLCVLGVIDPLLAPREDRQNVPRMIGRNLLAVASICALAFLTLWMGYGMRYAEHPGPALPGEVSALPATSTAGRVLLAIEARHLLPQAYLEGFVGSLFRVMSVQPGGHNAPWFALPLLLCVCTTLGFLAMALLSIPGVVPLFRQYRREMVFLLVPAAMFMAGYMRANWNGGVRHVLPAFPFLLLLVAAGCVEQAKRLPWMRYAIACLLVLHAASSLRAYPNYLSYANELWGGPRQAYKYLGTPDSGQSYWQVRDYMERHPSENCWLLTSWQWDADLYDPHCKAYGFDQPQLIPPHMHGTVIVSSNLLKPSQSEQDLTGDTFRSLTPSDYIGGSAMLVFRGDFDTSRAAGLTAERQAAVLLGEGRVGEATQLADYAVRIAPDNFFAHFRQANVLFVVGQSYQARNELETACSIAQRDRASDELLACTSALQQLQH